MPYICYSATLFNIYWVFYGPKTWSRLYCVWFKQVTKNISYVKMCTLHLSHGFQFWPHIFYVAFSLLHTYTSYSSYLSLILPPLLFKGVILTGNSRTYLIYLLKCTLHLRTAKMPAYHKSKHCESLDGQSIIPHIYVFISRIREFTPKCTRLYTTHKVNCIYIVSLHILFACSKKYG